MLPSPARSAAKISSQPCIHPRLRKCSDMAGRSDASRKKTTPDIKYLRLALHASGAAALYQLLDLFAGEPVEIARDRMLETGCSHGKFQGLAAPLQVEQAKNES